MIYYSPPDIYRTFYKFGNRLIIPASGLRVGRSFGNFRPGDIFLPGSIAVIWMKSYKCNKSGKTAIAYHFYNKKNIIGEDLKKITTDMISTTDAISVRCIKE